MPIWVDGDACPKVVKEILFRAAHQRHIPLTLVANQYIAVPASPFIKSLQVSSGFDVADNHIVDSLQPNDLVITADIPLAADALAKGAAVINPRGQEYTLENIGARLNMRDFMETMRASGTVMKDGPPPFSQQDRQTFANALDRWIARSSVKEHKI
ncbi:MAG TPA: YaiI/YqxD family protein [Cellvibrio sp.]